MPRTKRRAWMKGQNEDWWASYDGPGSTTTTMVMEKGKKHPVCIVTVMGIDDKADAEIDERVALIAAAPAMYAALDAFPYPSSGGNAAEYYRRVYAWLERHAKPALSLAAPSETTP